MYSPGYQQPLYSVSKRRITAQESACLLKPQQRLKPPLIVFSFMAIFSAVLIIGVPAIAAKLTEFVLFVVFVNIVVSAFSLAMRSRIAKIMKTGEVTVVRGIASWNGTQWTVGPITLRVGKKPPAVLKEGPMEVAVVTGAMGAALSINGVGLKDPMPAGCPANLDSATQAPSPSQPVYPPPAYPSQPQQAESYPSNQQQYEPNPNTPLPPPVAACPTCGAPLKWVSQYNRWYCDKCQHYK